MWEKVLIADDDVDSRSRFYEILSSLCYKVTCVPGGEEAILRLAEERFALILLDKDMPQLSGIDTARKIREFDKDIKIIILLEDESMPDRDSIKRDLGIRAIIKKDFSTHFMMKEIIGVLREEKPFKPEEISPQETKGVILVVDDNPEIRDVLRSFLEKKKYKVILASGGEEALMKINVEKPKVVLLDIRMPGMDGIMVLKRIKQWDESIPVVMLTSAQEEYIVQEAKKLGACDYLVKPCDLNKLDTLITSILLLK
jgi:CheY-like chemotaxis protein